jgi:hypothetical protein
MKNIFPSSSEDLSHNYYEKEQWQPCSNTSNLNHKEPDSNPSLRPATYCGLCDFPWCLQSDAGKKP